MANSNIVFDVSLGKFAQNFTLPAANDCFAVELYNSTNLEDDTAGVGLKTRTTLSDITSGTSATTVKCDSTNYPARSDASCGTTSGSATVTDTSITALDQGKGVTGSGIPAGTYVGTVTASTSFLLSSSQTSQVNVNATATATITCVIGGRVPMSGLSTSTTSHVTTLDTNDVVFPSVGGATNHGIGKAVVCYDPDTTVSGTHDANVIPQTGHTFSVTPDGSTITATVTGFAQAS